MTLSELIARDSEAQEYFSSLPFNAQETLMMSGQDFCSAEILRQRGEQFLRGEG